MVLDFGFVGDADDVLNDCDVVVEYLLKWHGLKCFLAVVSKCRP